MIAMVRDLRLVRWLCAAVVVLLPAAACAAAISQGYTATETIAAGAIVSQSNSKADQVSLADYGYSDNLLGVAVTETASTLAVATSGSKIQVASSGVAQVYVSTTAGEIKAGDPITASPIRGVGMRATASAKIIGIAQGGFDGSSAESSTTLQSESGAKRDVKIGKVPVELQVVYYVSPDEQNPIPPAVRGFAAAIAGKQVTPLRIVVAGMIILTTIMAVAVILFAAVRSSIISIGRNPLAHSQIYRGLIRTVGLSVGILLFGMGAVYVVLST